MSKTFTITSTIIAKFHNVCPSSSALTSTIISKFHNQILYIHHHIASLIHKTTTNSLRFKFKFYREGERGVADLAPVMSCSSSDGRGRAGGARSRKRWPSSGQTGGERISDSPGMGEGVGCTGWSLQTTYVWSTTNVSLSHHTG
jgi:hypothetical protein